MSDMHAKPKDHLWVLILIAACALTAVWGSWLQIGDKSGFAPLGPLGTGWTPAVIVEAYWGYTLFAWLAGAPGRRSRRFAMWSFFAMFTLSLIGQASSHLTAHRAPPAAVVVFMSDLPVVVVACVAVLIHLRQLDRAEAVQLDEAARKAVQLAAAEAAAADERTALRAQLEDALAAVEPLRADLETARNELARVTAKAESLASKMAAVSGAKRGSVSASKTRKSAQGSARADDLTTEFRALNLLNEKPELRKPRMGAELARQLGVSEATGRRLHSRLTAQGAPGESLSERSPDQSDERSDERS